MPLSRFNALLRAQSGLVAQCCKALAGLSLIIVSTVACDDARPPPGSDEPGAIARSIIAEFMSLPVTEVTLISLKAQDFNDSSLGCPVSGMAYQQVVTPGHLAIVEADGRRFDVRVAGGHGKICHTQKGNGPKRTSRRDSAVTSMIDHARRNLAGILNAEMPDIRVIGVRPYNGQKPPTGCTPRCAEPGAPCGYIIGLFYDGRQYDFHAVDGNTDPCPPILRS